MRQLLQAFFVATILVVEISASDLSRKTFVLREDTDVILHNPDMGWVLYENYPLDPSPNGSSTMISMPGESFPEVDAVAIMFSWQDVETRESDYDFSKVDKAYDYWKNKGKTIQLRLSTESLVWWSKRNPPAGTGVPEFVFSRIPATEMQTRSMEGFSYVTVDARNSFYRKSLARFLQAVNAHFARARPVTVVDLRGAGVWGEWHSGFRYPDLETRRTALMGILDIWTSAFPQRQLALNYSYDPDGPKTLYAGPTDRYVSDCTTNYNDFLRYSAFDYALTKTNITFRRDGCGGAVHSNERHLNEEAYRKFRRAPMIGEFLGGYGAVKQGGTNWVSWMIEDALSLHPNYLNLIGGQAGDAYAFASERPDLINRGLQQMGYRLMPTRVEFPSRITNGAPFEVRFEWVNRGVGRALRDYSLKLFLENSQTGRLHASESETISTSQWLAGEKHDVSHTAKYSGAPVGKYWLAIQVSDPETDRPIALPLTSGAEKHRYRIGRVEVSP
jgi:hypothetical protein